ncbi:hypothetical protein BD413DRAFT_298166 [Trametes elegans]|nr:hypothetical protein BD413DRAFT_298166 [Trametes elegans]
MLASPALTDASADGVRCRYPDCEHSSDSCSPPRLVYSPASSSSLALDTPLPVTPFSPTGSSPSGDYSLLSPTSCHDPQGILLLALPSTSKQGTTLAERRGAKALALKHAPTPADIPKPKLLSPCTPDTASSFTQRLVGLMRPSTPDPCSSPDYFENPLARGAGTFFADPYFFDAAPVRPHPDLYDLTLYQPHPPTQSPSRAHQAQNAKKSAKTLPTRLYIDTSDIGARASSPGGTQTHLSVPSFDRARGFPAPISSRSPATPSSPSPISATPVATAIAVTTPTTSVAPPTALPPPKCPSRATSSALPNLRPLLLPQKFAQREIEDAQAASILQHAAPTLRPLILPQELARRASHPQRPSHSRPHSPTVASGPAYHAHRRAFSTGIAALPYTRTMAVATGEYSDGRVSRAEQRRSQQLDDIISLLDESGVLPAPRSSSAGLDDAHTGDGSCAQWDSDSGESSVVATPPSVLSRSWSSSSFSFVSGERAERDSAQGGEESTSCGGSQKVEDILELLESEPALTGKSDVRKSVEEAEEEDLVCAYAM